MDRLLRLWITLPLLLVAAGCAAGAGAPVEPTARQAAAPTDAALSEPTGSPAHPAADGSEAAPPACPVTLANGLRPAESGASDFGHGNPVRTLFTILWPAGVVPFGPSQPGFVEADGSLAMKWPWYRSIEGELLISGRRLDAPAPPLRAWIPDGYGGRGFQSTALIFPTPGCWEVTGRAGEAELTFVTFVTAPADLPVPTAVAPERAIRGAIERYGLYPIPEMCQITPVGRRETRRHFTATWWDGVDGNRLAVGSAEGLLFQGPNRLQWQSKLPGEPAIEGTLQGAPGAALRVEALRAVPQTRFVGFVHESTLAFPEPGCWQVRAQVGVLSLDAAVYVYPQECRPDHLVETRNLPGKGACKPPPGR